MTRLLWIVSIASLQLIACGGGDVDLPDENPPQTDGGFDPNLGGRTIDAFTCAFAKAEVTQGQSVRVRAQARFSDGADIDVSEHVSWTVIPESIGAIETLGPLVLFTGQQPGLARLRARLGASESESCDVMVREQEDGGSDGVRWDAGMGEGDGGTGIDGGEPTLQEARAIWVTRFAWNTEPAVRAIIDRAADAGFNTVYFQIRGNGDAYYDSDLAPWAKRLTGQLGKDPGWDPLQVAIDQAHSHGIELHAYFNVFTGWTATAGSTTCRPEQGHADSCILPEASVAGGVPHVLRDHPEWIAVNAQGKSVDSEYLWLSPGNPAVRAHLVAVADELLTRYAVDGLHLDRVRYPGSTYSHDAASLAAYAALSNPKPSWEDWQRQNVTDTVAALYAVMKQRRAKAALSAAVWGIYKALSGCSTSNGYGGYYQDSLAWTQQGAIDALVPMIYWDLGTGCTDWGDHLDVFLAGANGRHVIGGMHALDSNAVRISRITARTQYGRSVGAAGIAVFASTYLEADYSGTEMWTPFHGAMGPFEEDAVYPAMPWR